MHYRSVGLVKARITILQIAETSICLFTDMSCWVPSVLFTPSFSHVYIHFCQILYGCTLILLFLVSDSTVCNDRLIFVWRADETLDDIRRNGRFICPAFTRHSSVFMPPLFRVKRKEAADSYTSPSFINPIPNLDLIANLDLDENRDPDLDSNPNSNPTQLRCRSLNIPTHLAAMSSVN